MSTDPKLSAVIICWNDEKYILNCIESAYAETPSLQFEVLVADNGSTDNSVGHIRKRFPNVRIIENKANLGFGAGNNAAIRAALGEYVLILNPDTVIRDRALEKLVAYADMHPEAGAVGCRVLNPDGTFQDSAQPLPTLGRYLVAALCLRWLGRFSRAFLSDVYPGWNGDSEREIGFHAACCLLIRRKLLNELGGFDSLFVHQFEDADLCRRIWNCGKSVLFCPDAEITHIGGQHRGGYPAHVVLATERSKYLYFQRYHGAKGVLRIRYISLIGSGIRAAGYWLASIVTRRETLRGKVEMHRTVFNWHWQFDPMQIVEEDAKMDPAPDSLAKNDKIVPEDCFSLPGDSR